VEKEAIGVKPKGLISRLLQH